MKRFSTAAVLAGLVGFLTVGLLGGCAEQEPLDYPWIPQRPITIIVPWAAGGATDQVTRLVASEIETALRQSVVVVNQPGATGSIGTREALHAKPDGYTWASGSSVSLGLYPVLDMLDTDLDDWHLFLTVANVPVISVNPDAPYEDFGDLLEALKKQPGKVSVGTAGIASSGHKVMELICQAADLEYRHVTYEGGNPAVISTVAGETQVTPQLATEQAEMIRAGRLRPLAAFSTEPLELEGHGTIAPVTDWLEDIVIPTDYFGIWVRHDVAPEVLETMEQVWREQVQNSEALQRYARQRGALFTPYYGEEARERTWHTVMSDAWTLYDIGQAEVSPEELGIPRP